MPCFKRPAAVAGCPGPRPAANVVGTKCPLCLTLLGCQALPNRRVVTCPGPTTNPGLATVMCPACKSRANLNARRGSISRMAMGAMAFSGLQLEGAWTQRATQIIEDLYTEFMPAGGWPCQYAFCMTGSGARKEACPYSDVDAFVVVQDTASAADKTAMINVSKQVRDRLIDMNFRADVAGPDQDKGFVFCIGGLNPGGWNTSAVPLPALTMTAVEFAGLLEANLIASNVAMAHVVSGLQEAEFVFGTRQLFTDLNRELNLIVGKTCWKMSSRPALTHKKRQGFEAIKTALNDFAIPAATATRFNVKSEFYRFPQFIAKGLAWYYNIPAVSTLDQISQLVAAKRMNDRNSRLFIECVSDATRVRVMSHLHSGKEADHIRAPNHPGPNPDNEYVMTQAEHTNMKAIITKLTRIQTLARKFVKQKDKITGKRHNPFVEE